MRHEPVTAWYRTALAGSVLAVLAAVLPPGPAFASEAVAAEGARPADPSVPEPAAGQPPTAAPATPPSASGRSGRAWWSPLSDRGWLGIRLATHGDLKRALASERLPDEWIAVPNLDWLSEKWDGGGAMVLEVVAESPAEKSGLLPGDVIQSFNGIRTQSPGVLVFVVQRALAGHDGELEVLRDGEKRRVLVEIGMHPEDARRLEEAKEAAEQEKARGEVKE